MAAAPARTITTTTKLKIPAAVSLAQNLPLHRLLEAVFSAAQQQLLRLQVQVRQAAHSSAALWAAHHSLQLLRLEAVFSAEALLLLSLRLRVCLAALRLRLANPRRLLAGDSLAAVRPRSLLLEVFSARPPLSLLLHSRLLEDRACSAALRHKDKMLERVSLVAWDRAQPTTTTKIRTRTSKQ